jgi:UDP-glucose 4-epimerase
MDQPLAWVLGAGGLLGRAVVECHKSAGLWSNDNSINWDDRGSLPFQIDQSVRQFRSDVGDADWRVLWCAGKGTVSSTREFLKAEGLIVSLLIDSLSQHFGPNLERGTFFYASSAGAIHSGIDGFFE